MQQTEHPIVKQMLAVSQRSKVTCDPCIACGSSQLRSLVAAKNMMHLLLVLCNNRAHECLPCEKCRQRVHHCCHRCSCHLCLPPSLRLCLCPCHPSCQTHCTYAVHAVEC